MKLNLANVTCTDEKAYNRLIHYLATVSEWKDFDDSQMCNVYVDENCDLIGFDSVKYRLQYVNNAHKLHEIMSSPWSVEPVPFSILRSAILAMG